MTEEQLKHDIKMYLNIHPDEQYTFEELFQTARGLQEPVYRMFMRRYGNLVEEVLG